MKYTLFDWCGFMSNNLSAIKYSIQDEKFKFHILKSELKKGSLISKKIHPIKDVENYKLKLIKRKLLKEYNDNYYILKKTIKIGGLMAFNLYSGVIKKEFEVDNPIVINRSDKMLKQELKIKNIFSTDSILHNNVNVGAYRLKRISKLEVNFNFISEHDADKFIPVEETIKNLLIKYSYISVQARHGISKLKECDIVDETTNKQIEVITEFKNRLKKDKTPQKNIDMLVIECVDNNLIKTSNALIEKYIKKDYTSKYEKQIAIFCIGTRQAVITMLEKLVDNLKGKTIKNNFTKLYMLFYDLVNEEYYWYPTINDNIEKVENIADRIIYKIDVDYKNVIDNEKYLIECINIFNSEIMIAYLTGKEIKSFANKIELIID